MGHSKKRKVHPKSRTSSFKSAEPTELVDAPHSFVIHRGLACPYIKDLTTDFRRIMEPFTASNLRVSRMNRIKDFVSMSSFFHVSHMTVFNKASTQLSFKILRLPRGPSLTFKVHSFVLSRDVISATKRQFIDESLFKHSPLVINHFPTDSKHLKLVATTFQNMFPPINVAQVDISTIRRCVLLSYNAETNLIEMRHYSIQVVPVGLKRGVKKIVMGTVPNMSKCEDIADYILNDGAASESEAEEDANAHVLLPQTLKRRGNLENNKSAVKLHEIGPRLTLQLIKIEEGLQTGEVLYHDHIVRTEEEKELQRKLVEKKRRLKELRKKQQTQNRAEKLKQQKKQSKDRKRNENANGDGDEHSEDDDAAYYEEAVGEKPDEDLFKKDDNRNRKRPNLPTAMKYRNKKAKLAQQNKK